jgi:fibronectin type 3 domain-containing protein
MRNSKHLFVVIAALVVFVGACGQEGGGGQPSVDTVPPVPPVGVQVQAQDDLAAIRWDDNAEIDLAGYRLYKSSFEDGPFGIVSSNLVYCPWFYDEVLPMQTAYYKVTAVDENGNESAFSQIVGIYYNTDKKMQPEAPSE